MNAVDETPHGNFLSIRRWALWRQRPTLVGYHLLIMVIVAAGTVASTVRMPISGQDLAILALLVACGVAQAELGRQIERTRRRTTNAGYINMTSVWFLPAALLLPLTLVMVLIAVLYTHLHLRSWYRLKQVWPFRTLLGAAVVALSCLATQGAVVATGAGGGRAAVHAGWAGAAAVAAAIAAYFVVNLILIIPSLDRVNRPAKAVIFGWADHLLEFATLCLGAMTAVVLVHLPAATVLVIAPLFVLHRAALIGQLESDARQDGKTGVWNAAGWQLRARQEMARAGSTFGVLMIDLDHFKQVNDTYGHLAGDAILRSVADTITATVRGGDSVGRFGGEEFVVLLPDLSEAGSFAVAERIRTRIAALEVTFRGRRIGGLSASIGLAMYPAAGTAIERIVQVADAAMYRAKANGRNQVVSFADVPGERGPAHPKAQNSSA